MTQPKFNLSLPLDVLNATLTALTAQQQALGHAIEIIKSQAQAQVDDAKDAEAMAAAGAVAATEAKRKADRKAARSEQLVTMSVSDALT